MPKLTEATYWNKRNKDLHDTIFSNKFHNIEYLFPVFNKYIPNGLGKKTAFELGYAPGQGLIKFCKRYGYIPNGADFTDIVDATSLLIKEKYPRAKFFKFDLSSNDISKLGHHDVILSNGFIEHFDDTEKMLKKHLEILKPNGYLILNTPNITFLRALIWKIFDFEVYKAHNKKATNLNRITRLLEKNDCRVLSKGVFGKSVFWIENNATDTRTRIGRAIILKLNLLLELFPIKSIYTSMGVYWIAQKN